MLSSFFPLIYCAIAVILLWQAFRVMRNGVLSHSEEKSDRSQKSVKDEDRTGRLTIHPELLDKEGRITNEELLTVRFSEDNDPPQSAETSAE